MIPGQVEPSVVVEAPPSPIAAKRVAEIAPVVAVTAVKELSKENVREMSRSKVTSHSMVPP